MAVNDVFQVTLQGLLHGQMTINTFHYRETATGVGDAQALLGGGWETAVVATLKSALSIEWSLVRLMTQKIFPLPPTIPAIGVASAGAGSNAAGSLPSSVAAVISKRTAFAGPKYRGRCFFAGVPTTSENDSQLSAAGVTAFGNLANAMEASITNGGYTWQPVLWHRTSKTVDVILSCDAQNVLRNQRRRQVGKGA